MKLNFKTVEWVKNRVRILDQTKLPLKVSYLEYKDYKQVAKAIKDLKIRGAPAIGIVAAYGVVLGMINRKHKGKNDYNKRLDRVISILKSTRPTAVNLTWALERMRKIALRFEDYDSESKSKRLLKEASLIHREDGIMCQKIGENGAKLLKDGYKVLTHCNAGALATGGIGTALAPIFIAKKQGKKIKVYVDETRPVLQGARLTTWELLQQGIDTTLICDDMAAFLMQKKMIDCIITGADRIVKNLDAANKIGTYNLAVLARFHKIPFYMAAPSSSFDHSIESGDKIIIEERSSEEVTNYQGKRVAPRRVKVFSPAFDVTPANLITAIITEKGVIKGKRKD
ncbi:MAG: S-methyl-5-thioribose-1-phosphate isomerase [candidate division Zixibacteria bacterium]|nr:S-methyl-5-thioribose-1-phosphate isomerase [candidate division Zixibacteria bacterium]